MDIFLTQQKRNEQAREIVFDLIRDLKPSPPPAPDFDDYQVRCVEFARLNPSVGQPLDRFVDKLGANLYRNLTRMQRIFEGAETLEEFSDSESESVRRVRIKLIENSHESSNNQASSGSKNKRIFFKSPESKKDVGFASPGEDSSGTDTSSQDSQAFEMMMTHVLYDVEVREGYEEETWDMCLGTLLSMAKGLDHDLDGDLLDSVNKRVRVLEDAVGNSQRPESSAFYGRVRALLLELAGETVQKVDEKRDELDMPLFAEPEGSVVETKDSNISKVRFPYLPVPKTSNFHRYSPLNNVLLNPKLISETKGLQEPRGNGPDLGREETTSGGTPLFAVK